MSAPARSTPRHELPVAVRVVECEASAPFDGYRAPSSNTQTPRINVPNRPFVSHQRVFSAMFWCVGAFVVGGGATLKLPTPFGAGSWIALAFAAALLMIGALVLYWVLGRYLNTTEITVADGMLTVRERPLPRLPVRIPVTDIAWLMCDSHTSVGGRGTLRVKTYALVAKLRSGAEVTLMRALRTPDVMLALEERLDTSWASQPPPSNGRRKSQRQWEASWLPTGHVPCRACSTHIGRSRHARCRHRQIARRLREKQ